MDELKITSKFMRTMISKLIKMALYKKFGCKIDIQINELNAVSIDGKTHVHLDIDADLEKDELIKILKNIGL